MKRRQDHKDLHRRYLIWCYKTTKEDLDRIDRYFTQQDVDQFLLNDLKKSRDYRSRKTDKKFKEQIDGFAKYMQTKLASAQKKKFKDSKQTALNPDYQYLQHRFLAIEKAIVHFLGKKDLEKIRLLYEEEMTQRILQAREHT